jgi:glycosyltransferase involved in cell wall biosynthesis
MHIALYHDAVIPPRKYGGTERIVYWLGKALIQLGHRVTLLAREGSELSGAQFIATSKIQPHRSWEDLLPSDVDVVHLWGTPGKEPKRPFLVTIQGNGKPGEIFHPNTVFISKRHALNHGAEHFVYNGIDPDEYPCDPQRKDHLVFLAKATWKVKNLAGALEIARELGLPLEVLGSRELPFRLQRYLPRWDGVKYHGMVDDQEKRAVLRNALALLFPVRWPEPFGIAITEALASGCAVFGTPYGSLPEIVDEQTGVLADSSEKLIAAIRCFNFNADTCRKRVYQGFTHLDMARSYLRLYETVQSRGFIHPKDRPPRAQFTESSETLLPWRKFRA